MTNMYRPQVEADRALITADSPHVKALSTLEWPTEEQFSTADVSRAEETPPHKRRRTLSLHTSTRRNAWALTPWMFLVQDAPAAPAKTKAMSVTSPWHCELQALDQTPVGKSQVIAHGDVTSNQDRIRWRARGGASDTDLPFPAA